MWQYFFYYIILHFVTLYYIILYLYSREKFEDLIEILAAGKGKNVNFWKKEFDKHLGK